MRFAPLVLLAAVGVSAHPSAHNHMRFHEKKDIEQRQQDGEVIVATMSQYGNKVVSWTVGAGGAFQKSHKPTPAPKPAPVPTPAAAPPPAAPAPTPAAQPAADAGSSNVATGGQSLGQGLSKFVGFSPCSAKKRATAAQFGYAGNTGCSGFGSNMKLIQSNIADKYDYKVNVQSSDKDLACVAFNKIGKDGKMTGFFNGNQALDFKVPAGSSQYIAFDKDTQGGISCAPGSEVPLTSFGQFAGVWLELDFDSTPNKGWSGFDASQLVAGKYGMKQYGLKACVVAGSGSGQCSTLYEGGGGDNAYLPGMEDFDGVGGNLPAGPVEIAANFGFSH